MSPAGPDPSRPELVRRIQVGLGGLCGVILLVGLTNIIIDNVHDRTGAADGKAAEQNAAAGNISTAAERQASEPLADLGVTPAQDTGVTLPAVPDLEPDPRLRTPMDRDPRKTP